MSRRPDVVPFPEDLRRRLMQAFREDRCEVFITAQEDLVIRYHAGATFATGRPFMGMYVLLVDVELP